MNAFEITLSCGHSVDWKEAPGSGGAPVNGLSVYCPQCEEDSLIEACSPEKFNISTIVLTDDSPKQDASHYGGYTAGEMATVFYDTVAGTYGYCVHGVDEYGNAYEGDDVLGWGSAEEAEEEARREDTRFDDLMQAIASGRQNVDLKDFEKRASLDPGWDWEDVRRLDYETVAWMIRAALR